MHKIISLLILSLICQFAQAQPEPEVYRPPLPFTFEINYWVNMHCFFLYEAHAKKSGEYTFLQDSLLEQMTADEQHRLLSTVNFYEKQFLSKNEDQSDYLEKFTAWIATQNERSITGIPAAYRSHCLTLIQGSLTFRNWIWDEWKADEEPKLLQQYYMLQQHVFSIMHLRNLLRLKEDKDDFNQIIGLMLPMENPYLQLPYYDGTYFYQGMSSDKNAWQEQFLQVYLCAQLNEENSAFTLILKEKAPKYSAEERSAFTKRFVEALILQTVEINNESSPVSDYLEKLISGKRELDWVIGKCLPVL